MKPEIIATIRKNPYDHNLTKKIVKAGAKILRFNLSHNKPSENREMMEQARGISKDVKIIADVPGSKIRLGSYYKPIPFEEGFFNVKAGQKYTLFASEFFNDEPSTIAINYQNLTRILKIGSNLIIGDGETVLEVTDQNNDTYTAIAKKSARVFYRTAITTEQSAMINAAFPENIEEILFEMSKFQPDFITLSFASTAEQVKDYKRMLKSHNLDGIPLIAKIETQKGIDNIKDIIPLVDMVMVARGDLALATDFSLLGIYQKRIVNACKAAKKEVIVSTQIMESLLEKYVPTRSDILDLTNIVLDGADMIMLCRETSYPDFADLNVKLAKQIIKNVIKYKESI